MKTVTANQYLMQLLDEFTPPGQSISPADTDIRWPLFLELLQCFCNRQQWDLEFDKVSDYSCAIFAQEEVADEQLPLFPDCDAVYAPMHRFMRGD